MTICNWPFTRYTLPRNMCSKHLPPPPSFKPVINPNVPDFTRLHADMERRQEAYRQERNWTTVVRPFTLAENADARSSHHNQQSSKADPISRRNSDKSSSDKSASRRSKSAKENSFDVLVRPTRAFALLTAFSHHKYELAALLDVCLPACLSRHLFACTFVCSPVCPSVCLHVYRSCLSGRVSVHAYLWLSCSFVFLYCLSVCWSAWRSIGWPVCLFVCVPALPVDSPVCLHLCCLCYLRVCPLVCAPVCLTAYPFVCLPIGSLACFSCLPVLLPGRLSVWLFRLSIHLFVCLSAYLLANCALH